MTFGEVARNVDLQERNPLENGIERYVGLDHIEPGNLHIRSWGNVADGTTFTRRFKAGQVLFGKRRAYQRKAAIAEFDGICSGDILVFVPSGNDMLPELLPFIVESDGFFAHALRTSAGSLSPRTKWKELATYAFPLPPKDEQRRIADTLWAADATVERWREVARITTVLTDLVLAEELHIGRERGWKVCPVRDLVLSGPQNGISPPANAQGVGYRTLSISSIRNGRVEIDGNTKFAAIDQETFDRFRLTKGDVLVVRGNGNRQLVGLCGTVNESASDIFYPDLLVRLRFDEHLILREFATAQWNSNYAHSRLLKKAKSTNGIWKVNGKDLASHELVAPPLDEQRRLLLKVKALAHALESASANVDALVSMKSATSKHLLAGESQNV